MAGIIAILSWLASDMSYNEIVEDFPLLTRNDILVLLAFAAHRGENTKVLISMV
ncbi:DUF433 domain-containing protein [Emticicia sp. SJ17W-69]|uniref:DUF433 domain-containing protein n=1 Tax=Emticicia sp. SJ17W-69 TaxID=3421657 RepID=UPI003EBAC451